MAADRDDEGFENGKTKGGGLSDMMKKALFAGLGAVFMTEESVRAYVSDSKLPRDIGSYLIKNTGQAKEQFFGYLAKELSGLVRKSDLPKVVQGFLRDHTIEIEARIRFRDNGAPEVSGGARAVPPAPAPTPTPAPNGGTTPPAGVPSPTSAPAAPIEPPIA
jgi:hypothetical protein